MIDFLFFSFLQPAPQPKAKKAEKKKRKRTKKGKNSETFAWLLKSIACIIWRIINTGGHAHYVGYHFL